MVGRRRFLLSFLKCMCFIFSVITVVGRRALKRACGEPITHFPLHPALSGVARDTLEAACGVVQQ